MIKERCVSFDHNHPPIKGDQNAKEKNDKE